MQDQDEINTCISCLERQANRFSSLTGAQRDDYSIRLRRLSTELKKAEMTTNPFRTYRAFCLLVMGGLFVFMFIKAPGMMFQFISEKPLQFIVVMLAAGLALGTIAGVGWRIIRSGPGATSLACDPLRTSPTSAQSKST
jgi:hypothetical protein